MANDELLPNIYGVKGPAMPEYSPTFSQTLSAAFGLENDVANAYDWATRETYAPDPTFDYRKPFEAGKLPGDWRPILAGATSQQDFDAKLMRVRQETKDKAVLASSGWAGTVSAIGSGMLSPTVFIPFVGQGRRGWAMAEILGLAAAGATVSEATLYLNQETRTEGEMYTGIAMNTLLGGLLGAGWLRFTKSGQARMMRDVEVNQGRELIPEGPLDSGTRMTRIDTPDIEDYVTPQTEVMTVDEVMEKMFKGLDEPANVNLSKPLTKLTVELAESLRLAVMATGHEALGVEDVLRTQAPDLLTFLNTSRTSPLEFARQLVHEYDGSGLSQAVDRLPEHVTAKLGREEAMEQLKDLEGQRAKRVGDMGDSGSPSAIPASDRKLADDVARGDGNTLDAQPVGAAVTNTRNARGAKIAPAKWRQAAMTKLGKLSPQFRMATSKVFPSLRHAIYKLDNSGLAQAGLDEIDPSAMGGTVVDRVKTHDFNIAEYMFAFDSAYYKHIHGQDAPDAGTLRAGITLIRGSLGAIPPSKMSPEEFHVKIYDGLSTGKADPETAPAVEALRKFFEYYNKLHKDYLAEIDDGTVSPLYKELMEGEFGAGVENYAHQIYDPNAIRDKSAEFIQQHSEFFRNGLEEAFKKSHTNYLKRKAKMEFDLEYGDLTAKEQADRLGEIEAGIKFLDETPELEAYAIARADLRRQAREEGWEATQLKEQLKDLDENLDEATAGFLAERKGLVDTRRSMRKLGGDATANITKLQGKLDKANNLIETMFRHDIPGIERADLSIGRTQREMDKALASVQKPLKKVLATLKKRQEEYQNLLASSLPNMASRTRVAEKIAAKRAEYDALMQRLDDVGGQNVALEQKLHELHYIREAAVKDARDLVRSRSAKAEDLEMKLDDEKASILTPEEQAKFLAEQQKRIDDAELNFDAQWRDRGDRGGDPASGKFDFHEASDEMAVYFMHKLTNSDYVPSSVAVRQDKRGAQLMRMLALPYDIKKNWLVRNTETVARAYDRTMGPDLELWRAFGGSVNGRSVLEQMGEEASTMQLHIASAKFVRLPHGWLDKATKFGDRVKRNLAEFGEGEDLYLSGKNFSDTGGDGFVPMTPELRTQLTNALDSELSHQTRNFDIAVQRIRNTRGVPDDPNSIMWRTGRALKNLNVVTMMGNVVIASIADIARPVYQHGIAKTAKQGWAPFIRNLSSEGGKKYRVAAGEVNRRIGLTLEPILHGRAQSVMDLIEPYAGGKSKLERGLQFAANKTGLVAMFDYWTAGMKAVSAAVVHTTMGEYIPRVAAALRKGEIDGDAQAMLEYLRERGLRTQDILKIDVEYSKPGGMEEFSNGAFLPNFDNWSDMEAWRAYSAAVTNEVNKLIVAPGLERPNWVDENLGYSLVAQFRSFTFASNSRMMMSNLQGSDPYLVQGALSSLALGALSYYAYAQSIGGKAKEKAMKGDLDDWLYEAVDRSGLLGALSLGQKVGEQIPMLNQFSIFGGEDKPYRRASGFWGTVFGPSVGKLEGMAEFVKNMDNPDALEKNIKTLKQLIVPYQNHFILRQAFDKVGEAMAETFGD